MIKLVASDMDGTLLDERSRVPQETFDLIRGLTSVGVRFCAASGRRFDTLQEFFGPVASSMDFVASNGAQVVVNGILVDREVFSHAAELVAMGLNVPCMTQVLLQLQQLGVDVPASAYTVEQAADLLAPLLKGGRPTC